MSDSLKATVIVSRRALTISANPEVEDEEEDEPRLPAIVPEPVDGELPDEPFDDDELPLLDEETASPGLRLSSDTTVPLAGA
jgi:hypothetical protein